MGALATMSISYTLCQSPREAMRPRHDLTDGQRRTDGGGGDQEGAEEVEGALAHGGLRIGLR